MRSSQRSTMIAVAATLVLLTAEGAIADPEPCTFNVSDGCRCHTDTMTLDISDYFKYPVEMDDPVSKYNYTYSPCVPFECGPGEPAVLCQRGLGTGEVYALGRLDNSTTWYVESYSPLRFTIHYYNGDPSPLSINRDALVNMMYSNSTMSAKFTSEGPILTYHFDITGDKVVPQQEVCEFDPTDSCRCHTNTMSLDISDYFKYPVEMMNHDAYKYSYSPCTPIRCGTESAMVCQELMLEERFEVVARFDNSTTWYVNSYNPLQFTIHYYGGDAFRNAVFNMSYENSAMSAKVTTTEPVLTYRFSITGNKVVPKPEPEPGLCTFYPSDSCRCYTDTISLDISKYFQYPVKIVSPDGNYNYLYAPCLPIPCGTEEQAVVCQEEIRTGAVYSVARFDKSTTWFVNSYNPLQFTIHYYDGEQGREAIFVMSYKDSTMSAKFISEDPVLTYNFDITGNEVVPASASSITPYPSDCITSTTSVVVTMVTTVTMTPTACYPAIGTETELAVTHITTLTLPHSPSPPPLSSTEEEEEVRQKGLVSIHARAGFNKLILLGTLVLLFLVLLLPVMAHRRRSATDSGYSPLPSKQKDILC